MGQGLEEKEGETGDPVVGLEEQDSGEEFVSPDHSWTEENRNGKDTAGHI